ncbi:hypothetical protein N3K66_007579 [Trichothecium roseum]|uniref:Uncharacterized protein n=1 Tax=Trichothecium roseum TaxID=47278 RepID=A0ACC0UUD2_9HYPO|nr:hypothetical protein N3K66_007579 [Trichothecium roseum]
MASSSLVTVLLAAAAALLLPLLYGHAASSAQRALPALRGRRVCLLIAHPDDEAMFFSPTVLALTRPGAGNHVRILCLSTGDADGLGETRRRELVKSGAVLGVRDEADVFVIDDKQHFPDSMTATWDADRIANLLSQTFAPKPDAAADPSIDVLVTFDARGVSSHPNHVSLYHGARAFVSSLATGSSSSSSSTKEASAPPPVTLYTLRTVGVARKYASIIDGILTRVLWSSIGDDGGKKRGADLLFMSALRGGEDGQVYGRGFRAMTEAHRSQMRWFRYGWILLSRYMVVNELTAENV